MVDFSKHLRNQKSMDTVPKDFPDYLDPKRDRLVAKQAAALVKAVIKDKEKFPHKQSSEIKGPIDFQWIRSCFGDGYVCGFNVRAGRIQGMFSLVTPSNKEFNGDFDVGSVGQFITEEEWIKLSEIVIPKIPLMKEDKKFIAQSTEKLGLEYSPQVHCQKCHESWGRVLTRGHCICTGDVQRSMASPPGELSPLPPEQEQPRVEIIECFMVAYIDPKFPGSPRPFDTGFDLGKGETGLEYPKRLGEGTVFLKRDKAEMACYDASRYLSDSLAKKKNENKKQK